MKNITIEKNKLRSIEIDLVSVHKSEWFGKISIVYYFGLILLSMSKEKEGRMNEKNKRVRLEKGFTLVEIIVVLVVLAVLAAFTIPTMLGFVEDAKAKAYIAEAREVYVAAQAVATEYIGTGQNLETGSDNPADALNSYWVSGANNSSSNPNKAASLQMRKYLSNDLKISNGNYRSTYQKGDSYWFVIMDKTPGKEGAVKQVYYVKNDHVIWYSDATITVEKLIKEGNLRPNVPWNKKDGVPTRVY